MVTGAIITDGLKAIPLEQLPPEAWTTTGGDSVSGTAELYSEVGWLYRCVHIRASTLAAIPWQITTTGGDSVWDSTEGDPPDRLSGLMDLPRLLGRTEASLCLTSEAYWYIWRNRVRVTDLSWLAASTMTPKWEKTTGKIAGYERRLPRVVVKNIPPEEIVYTRYASPLHETATDTAPAAAAASSAEVLQSVDEFATGFFDRGAIKATLLNIKGNVSQSDFEKIESWWKRFFRGVTNAWESAAIRTLEKDGGVEPVTVGEGISDLANTDLTREQRENIATTMGVPHSLVFSNAANFATAQIDMLSFYNQTILPDAKLIEQAVNQQLLSGMGLSLSFLPQQLSVFQEDEEQRSTALVNLTNAGMPLHMALVMLGFDVSDEDMATIEAIPVFAEPPEDTLRPVVVEDGTRATELSRFRRWAKKRKQPDPDDFESGVLTDQDKKAVLFDLGVEDGTADDAPFLVADFDDYP